MKEGDVAEDGYGGLLGGGGDAEGGGGVAVYAAGAAIAVGVNGGAAGLAELVYVADGQAVAGEKVAVGGQQVQDVGDDGEVGEGSVVGGGVLPDGRFGGLPLSQPIGAGTGGYVLGNLVAGQLVVGLDEAGGVVGVVGPNAVIADVQAVAGLAAVEVAVEPFGCGECAKAEYQIGCGPIGAELQQGFVAANDVAGGAAKADAGDGVGEDGVAADFCQSTYGRGVVVAGAAGAANDEAMGVLVD